MVKYQHFQRMELIFHVHLICYSRACSVYLDLIKRQRLLSTKAPSEYETINSMFLKELSHKLFPKINYYIKYIGSLLKTHGNRL